VRAAAAGGVLWTASSQGIRQLIQVAVTAVLTRYLLPDDFGLIGMAAVTLAAIAPINEMGMSAALVQRKDLTPGHAAAVFWCQVAAASLLAGLLAFAAPLIARFFHRDELVALVRVLCVNLPMGAAAAAPQALLLRDLRFGRLAWVETISLAAAGGIGCAMAASGWGVWSLAAQALAGSAVTALLVIPLARFNPLSAAARPRLAHVRDLAGFSAPLAGYQILNFVSRNVDDILIGRFLGAEALGYYSLAYRVMMYPLQKVSGVVGRVAFPVFSSIQDDLARIRSAYLKAVQFIALVTFPMMAAVMVAAPEFTRVLFGPSWAPVAALIMVLSPVGMAASIGTTVGTIFLARGRSDLMLKWEIAATTCYTAAIVGGLSRGLMGVAVSYTVMALILWPISHVLANRLIELPMREFFHSLAPSAALAAVLAAALMALKIAWGPAGVASQAAFLTACVALGAGAFMTAAWIGRPAAAAEALALARETLGGMRGIRRPGGKPTS